MADNFPQTAGSGRNIATDQVTHSGDTADVQLVRVVGVSGSEGSKTPVDTPAREQARIAVQTSSLSTSLAYVAGDQVGTLLTLANAARASGGYGVITSVLLTNANDVIGAYDVVFFRASVTLASDSSPFSISAADTRSVVAVVPLTSAVDLGSGRVAQALNIAIPYDCSGGTSLYAALICRAGHAVFAANTDLELVVHVERA